MFIARSIPGGRMAAAPVMFGPTFTSRGSVSAARTSSNPVITQAVAPEGITTVCSGPASDNRAYISCRTPCAVAAKGDSRKEWVAIDTAMTRLPGHPRVRRFPSGNHD